MLKKDFYIYGQDNLNIPSHCNYGKDIFSKLMFYKNNTALIDADSGNTMTYLELAQQTVSISLSLARMNIKRGDVVGICSEKRLEVMPTMLGIICAGATYVPLNVTYGKASFLHRLSLCSPSVVFCSPDAYYAHKEQLQAGQVRECVVFGQCKGNSFSKFLDEKAPCEQFLPAHVDGWNDNIFLLFSSGTTGLPKGIPMTHYSFLLLHGDVGVIQKIYSGAPMLSTREWYYTYGLLNTLACLYMGSTIVFSPRNQEEDLLQAVQNYKVEIMQACPTTVNMLVKSALIDKYKVSSLKYIISTSTPCGVELLQAVKNRFPNLRDLYQLYGMSETGVLCSELRAPYGCRAGSVGCVNVGVIIKVVDLKTRQPLGPNQRGEICFKSQGLMKGYLGDVDINIYLDEEQFFKTGDIGYYDEDQYFYIVDRIKDMIKYYDVSVAPAEFEDALLKHPAVREVGVVGAPHATSGEVPVAFVVLQPGAIVTSDDLVKILDEQVSTEIKLVGGVRFVDKLPRGAGDKLDRKALKLML